MKKRLYFVITIFVVLFVFSNTYNHVIRAATAPQLQKNKSIGPYNPYNSEKKFHWRKSVFHIHTDSNTFTKERHSPENVVSVYRNNGYDIVALSDYKMVTKAENDKQPFIPAYEWGSTPDKRHLLSIGAKEPVEDPFYLFATNSNIQWAINQMKEKDSFVVVNHPKLYSAFSLNDLLELKNYDAMEVFSPFGDDNPDLWDKVLTAGKRVHCMASDDLHVFPDKFKKGLHEPWYKKFLRMASFFKEDDGESLIRYVLLNTDSFEKEDVVTSLREGNYTCVRKYSKDFEDPKINSVKFRNGELQIKLPEKALRIEFVADGELVKTIYSVASAAFKMGNKKYVRANIHTWNGILLTNPVYQ